MDREGEGDRRPAVKARFERETFEQIRRIKEERGLEWRTIILMGVAEAEESVPPVADQYDAVPPEAVGFEHK